MIKMMPDNITKPVIAQYLDLRGLSTYSSLKVPTLRDHIRAGTLPAFKVKGKILVKRSEFDRWIENYRINQKQELAGIINGILGDLKISS